jgi:hypothetical protein
LTGRPDRQPGQVSLERTEMTGLPGHDKGVTRAVANAAWAGQLEQDSYDRTAGTGQMVRTGHLGLDNWSWTAETGRTGQVSLLVT